MKRASLFAMMAGAVALAAIALVVFVVGSERERHTAQATGTVQEEPANVALIGTRMSWKVVSKATFDADRVIVEIGKGSQDQKVSGGSFICQSSGQGANAEFKGHQKDVNITPGLQHHEIWSGTFASKCIGPGGGVDVILSPVDPTNKLVIKEAHVENTTSGPVHEGPINFARVSPPSINPQEWKVQSKSTIGQFNRIEVDVGKPTQIQKVQSVQFICQLTGEAQPGVLKRHEKNVNAGPLIHHEVWSAVFSQKCITHTSGVTVRLQPVNPSNELVIKDGRVQNTTCCRANVNPPGQGGHASFTFKVTSKATFPANRVEVDVGKATQTQKVASATFAGQPPCPIVPRPGVFKRHEKDVNPPPDPLPHHEVCSVIYPTKCLSAGGGVFVILVPVDPNNQLVVKEARVQNIDPAKPTATPTNTPPLPPPTPTPTKPTPNGQCTKVAQDVLLQGKMWDQWKCTPNLTVLFNRVDISVGKADQDFKLDPTRPPRFVCQLTREKVIGVFKAHKKNANPPPTTLPNHEIWSGEFKQDCNQVDVYLKPRLATNHPAIKEVSFSTVAPPPKLPSPGDTDGDGCSDVEENGLDETLGGRRNYRNPYDFYDAETVNTPKIVTLFDDIFAVAKAFDSVKDGPGYSAQLDRSDPLPGEDPWDTHKPDGIITLFSDTFRVSRQFDHNCTA